MQPTIGQPVIFHPEPGISRGAIIAAVHSENLVDLAFIRSFERRENVCLVAPGHAKPEFSAYCEFYVFADDPEKSIDISDMPVTTETIDALKRGMNTGMGIEPDKTATAGAHVTAADIAAAIIAEDYQVFDGTTVTVCLLTLRNGAKVIGHNYGSIDPARQDWEWGKKEARAMAVEKVWELEGYLVRERR